MYVQTGVGLKTQIINRFVPSLNSLGVVKQKKGGVVLCPGSDPVNFILLS